jgi:hypothetical protein
LWLSAQHPFNNGRRPIGDSEHDDFGRCTTDAQSFEVRIATDDDVALITSERKYRAIGRTA